MQPVSVVTLEIEKHVRPEESRPISSSESLVVRALLGDGAIGDRSFQVLRAMRRRTRDAIPRGDTRRSDAEDTSDFCYCRGDGGY